MVRLLATLLAMLGLTAVLGFRGGGVAGADAVPRFEPAGLPAGRVAGSKPPGRWLPTVGHGNGHWELSVGARVWDDHFTPRNLIAEGEVDLGPGLRAHLLARHNRELDRLDGWAPNLDEAYIEGYGFYTRPHSALAASLRIGKVRYLRFPYPDAIAVFDQVPGVADLQGRFRTGYSGAVLALEYAHDRGLGAHFTGIAWGFDGCRPNGAANAIEDYAFYRRDLGDLRFEARAGGIASRQAPLGGPAREGCDIYLGLTHAGYTAGALYEKRRGEPAYTGVMIAFPSDTITRTLGRVGFDYTRTPEGLAVQAPVARGRFGFARCAEPAASAEPVGEVVAVRTRTYWQAGLQRNFYEHRISARGETADPRLVVTVEEHPYYLWAEALVSPHTSLDAQWFHDRQGPAHNSRLVIYRFYRPGR
ncbi:MAG TPA: hypothetical protein VM221_09965 [Armatimonadota bacterium]|nr:hypothetical protein [Armatimonadota bacterium]